MEMPANALLDLLEIFVSHLTFLRRYLESCFYKPSCNSLNKTEKSCQS